MRIQLNTCGERKSKGISGAAVVATPPFFLSAIHVILFSQFADFRYPVLGGPCRDAEDLADLSSVGDAREEQPEHLSISRADVFQIGDQLADEQIFCDIILRDVRVCRFIQHIIQGEGAAAPAVFSLAAFSALRTADGPVFAGDHAA